MENGDVFNQLMKNQFEADPTEQNFTLYIMSEVQAPIEDLQHVMDLIEERMDVIRDIRLLFMAADLNSYWRPDRKNVFLEKLNERLDTASDSEKAIIYYLKAMDIHKDRNRMTPEEIKLCRSLFEMSIHYAKGMHFANNRYFLATISDEPQAKKLMREARDNVQTVHSQEEVEQLPDEYWMDIQQWIDETILGIKTYEFHYSSKYSEDRLK